MTRTVSDDRGVFAYTPMTDFLSMKCPIIDFANLKIGINPVGYGSTSMVYPALLNGSQLVAVKVFSVDNITIKSVAHFFRETLLSADIHHPNIVKFLGCCIRPPEICLVHEICSHGDLASFIFAQRPTEHTRNSRGCGHIFDTPLSDTFNRSKYNQYDAERSPQNPMNDVLSIDIPSALDIVYAPNPQAPTTFLSTNTTIDTIPTVPTTKRVLISPKKTILPSINDYPSPTDDSSINSNKFVLERSQQEIVNSLKENMSVISKLDENNILSMNSRLYLLLDIAKGMSFLHQRNMLHRDLKTGNVLVQYDPEQKRFLAKVCDFGSSRYIATQNDHENGGNGTPLFGRELSLTNYKNVNKLLQKKRKKNKRALRFKKHGPNRSMTDDSKSFSMTATSTRYNFMDDTKECLLPEPIRNLSAVAYTAPENLGHIDFSSYQRLHNNYRARDLKIKKEDIEKKIMTKHFGVDITPLFEGNSSLSIDNGDCNISMRSETTMGIMDKDISITKDDEMNSDIDLKSVFGADVFSFGVIIWEVMCVKPIYNDMNMIEIRDMILNGDRLNLIHFDDLIYLSNDKSRREREKKRYESLQELMSECWQQSAKLRPTFDEIVLILHDIICNK